MPVYQQLVTHMLQVVVLFFVLPVSPEKAGPADVTVELEDPTDPIIGLEEE